MTSEATQTHRSIVVLKLPTKVSGLAATAQQMVTSMTGNAAFPTPAPALATVSSAISDFQTAEAAALVRTKGATATRNAKRRALVQLLEQLKTYVQTVADASASDSEGIIQSAGMAVRKTAVRAPRVFNAVQGDVSGSRQARHGVRGSPRGVQLAVQPRRRQDLGGHPEHPSGQDDRRGSDCGNDGRAPVPGAHQDG